MYRDDIVLSIKQIEKNLPIAVSSLRSNTNGITLATTPEPTLRAEFDYTRILRIISISIPNTNNKTGVRRIEVAFIGPDDKILRNARGDKWIIETIEGVTEVCLPYNSNQTGNITLFLDPTTLAQ